MGLMDSLRQGSAFIDDLQRGRVLDAQARYADPMAAAGLFQLQTENQYLPEKLRLANQYQGLANTNQSNVNRFFIPEHQADLENKRLENEWYSRKAQAAIDAQNSLGDYRAAGGSGQRFAPADVKRINALRQKIKAGNPSWSDETVSRATDAYLNGDAEITIPSAGNPLAPSGPQGLSASSGSMPSAPSAPQGQGQPPAQLQGMGAPPASMPQVGGTMKLPPLGGQAQQILTGIRKSSSTAAIQNQAANLANTANELNNVDINPAKEFSGVTGKAKYLYQKFDPSSRTDSWRAYDAFRNVKAILVMDTLRNGLKTSQVPSYVNETIGKFSNPNDEIWDDPEQVATKWKALTDWVNRSAQNTAKQADKGATAKLDSAPENNASSSNSDPLGIRK